MGAYNEHTWVGAIMTIMTLGMTNQSPQSKRPFIKISANGLISSWLFDTGAEVCCMSLTEFRKIEKDKRPLKMFIQNDLRCASKTQLKVKGTYLMNLNVLGRTIQQPVFVCENLGQTAILGIDAIEKLGLNYQASKKEFIFDNELGIFKNGTLYALSAHSVPPLTSQPIRVSALETTGCRPPAGVLAVATVHAPEAPLLSGGPGLVTTDQLGHVTVMLQNCSPNAVHIERGDILGSIECIQGQYIQKVKVDEIAASFEKVQAINSSQLTNNRKMEMIKDINLNVPQNEQAAYLELILRNHDVFSKDKNDLGLANHYKHSITLRNNEPLYIKQFKIPDIHRKMLEGQVKEWLKLGIIQRSNSKYNSPVFIVPKKEPGQFRFVQDFRQLNQNSLDDKYCMKDVNECIGEIGRAGSTIFTTLDLTSGFWQMPLNKESREYTAFTIPGMGQFEWLVSAMGLKSCPAGFQRLVELAMQNLKNVIVYIDDLILHSNDHQTHRKELQELFDRLRKTGLKVNLKKCHFGSNNVSYLGFRLTPKGILPGTDKLQAVRDTEPPKNVHQVRSFLGLCNFFRSHVRNFSFISNPLNQLTRKDCAWRGGKLNDEALKAFNELKSALCSEPVVAYPRKDRPYSLIVDAATGNGTSEGGIGAILCQQDIKGNYCVIAYASRALIKHEKNYTPFLLEMMAAVWAMEHFDSYLRGRKFTLFTDHRPLEKLATVHKKTLNRLQEAMLVYDFKIVYKNGKEMPADFLSRNVLASIDVFNDDLPRLQKEDEFISNVLTYITTQKLPADMTKATHVRKIGPECFIDNDIVWRRLTRYDAQPRSVLLLPSKLATEIVQEAHGQILTGHDGIAKTKERLLQSYYWPNMDSDVINHIKACIRCQSRRVDHRPKPHLLTPLPQCSEPNQRVHVDMYGPLKTSDSGKKYVLVMTDAFSKYAEVVATPNKESATVSLAIFNRWICRFGCPLEIVSDGGKEFVNKLSAELYSLLKIKHAVTTAYHPQCNAQVERFNQTVGKYLASFTDSSTLDWELYLAPLAFSYNTSLHRTIKATPYSLTFGQEARLPSFPNPDIQRQYGESEPAEWYQRLQQSRQLAVQHSFVAGKATEDYYNKGATAMQYRVDQLVWLQEHNFLNKNRKIAPQWTGPYKILKVFDFGVIDIEYKGKCYRVNNQRLKPFVPNIAEPQLQIRPPLQQQQQQHQETRSAPLPRPHTFPWNSTNTKPEEAAQATTEGGEEMQQNIPPVTKRGRGRPRKTESQMKTTENKEAQQSTTTQQQNDSSLLESQRDAPAVLLEKRITRSMTKATESAPATVTQGDVVQIKWGIATLHPHTKLRGYVESKRKILKRNKALTGDSAFPFDTVKYSLPYFKQQQPQQIQPDAEPNPVGFQDDDNDDDSDSDETLVETENEAEENFDTADESEEENIVIQKPEQQQRQQQQQQRRFTPPPFAQWRATRTTPSPEASSQSSFSQRLWAAGTGARNLLGAFASVPHPPGARPHPPTTAPRPGTSGTGRERPTPGTTGQDRTPHRSQNLDHPTPRRSSREKKQPKRLGL